MDLTTKGVALIQISTVIDLEKVKNEYPKPSTNKQYPTGIESVRASMTCTGSRGSVSGQGSPNLEFGAYVGDIVSFNSAVTSNSSAYTASIYSIQNFSGTRIFNELGMKGDSIELKVQNYGMTILMLLFGIYTKDDSGKPKDLIGCFYFDPSITIQS
jgi:hypothetical protein